MNILDHVRRRTEHVVVQYSSISHEAWLKAFKEVLDRREKKDSSTDNLVKMAEFVLKNNYLEFMDEMQTKFLEVTKVSIFNAAQVYMPIFFICN